MYIYITIILYVLIILCYYSILYDSLSMYMSKISYISILPYQLLRDVMRANSYVYTLCICISNLYMCEIYMCIYII